MTSWPSCRAWSSTSTGVRPYVDEARLRRELKGRHPLAHTWFLDRVGRHGMIRDEAWAHRLVSLIAWIWTNHFPPEESPASTEPVAIEPEGDGEHERRLAFEYDIHVTELAGPVAVALVEPALETTPTLSVD